MDFKTCGEIVVSPKHNVFAISCNYCQQRFSQLQAFMRHLQLHHADKLEFGNKEKSIEVYAIEELMTTLNQSSIEEAESEESGVAEADANWLTVEDQKWLDEGDAGEEKGYITGGGLENISILKALEDCDVSLNLVNNLDEKNCEIKENTLNHSENEEDDDILNNTLLQKIQNDLDVSELEECHNKSAQSANYDEHNMDDSKELEVDGIMADTGIISTQNEENITNKGNIKDCLISNEALGLKGLLEGLEDLEDVDSFLENLEDSLAGARIQDDVSNMINSNLSINKDQFDCEKDIIESNFEAPVLEDMELTVNHKDEPLINETVTNYKLAIKNPKDNEKETLMSRTYNENQQKMVINIESGELENVSSDLNHLEDSLEEENFIYNKFINKSTRKNDIPKNFKGYKLINESNPDDSLMQNSKSQTNEQQDLEEDDFEVQLKNLEASLDNENSIFSRTSIKIPKNCPHHKNLLKTTKSDGREDFDLQLKELEASLNEDNIKFTDLITKNGIKFKNSHNLKINRENSHIKHTNNKELADEKYIENANSLPISRKNTKINKKKPNQQDLEGRLQHLEDNDETPQEIPSIVPLNNDLTKALEEALEGDDFSLLNMEMEEDNDPPLNQDLKDLLAQGLLDEVNEMAKPTQIIKSNTNKRYKESAVNQKEYKAIQNKAKSLNLPSYESRYGKTNLKAKIMSQNPLNGTKNSISMNTTQKIRNQNTKILCTKLPFSTNNVNQISLKANHELNLQQQQHKSKPLKLKTPETQSRQRKPFIKEEMENFTPDFIRKIKKEKLTPHQSFINTERGDRTPLKKEELFLEQSPKTQEKPQDIEENFTPKRGERTPKTKEQMFLKQSPKTQEKNNEELSHDKTQKRGNMTPKTRAQLILKKSPKTQEKTEYTGKNKLQKTPGKINESAKIVEAFSKECKVILCRTSPVSLAKTSPLKTSSQNIHLNHVATPKTMKNLTIKLPRLTPVKLKQNAANERNKQQEILKSQSPTIVKEDEITNNKTLIKPENKIPNKVFNDFKLPNGITITKISPSNSKHNLKCNFDQTHLDETPIKSNYCKQNFSECSLEPQNLKEELNTNAIKFTMTKPENQMINSLKTENSTSTLRQRKASIDIVPPLPKIKSHATIKSTPKHTNLDYKSYAVNRSARKKEVLQRMSHIKKQIFKSIENSHELIKFKHSKSPPKKPQRKHKLQIENVQILPNLERGLLTPFDNFKKPLANNVTTPPVHNSPKNLNDDEKQAKKSLHVPPASNSPINDDEKLNKKSFKRPATSPLLDEEKQAKRLQKSPTVHCKDGQRKSSDLETTHLGLSESVVEYLQRDLKANRLNEASFLNFDLPIDDNSPNESSIESNGNEKKTANKDNHTTDSSNHNILDDLLNQVDNEQKSNEETADVHQKEIPTDDEYKVIKITNDFNGTKDLSLLNIFGLKVIKLPDIEDRIPLEEAEEMRDKAKKFADIYRNWQRIWSSKNGENSKIREELNISFQQLLTLTNLTFQLDLEIYDLKRLVNLITMWYSQNFNSKLIEKKNITESTNYYLLLFHYIPKTVKRVFYCEYCEEHFTTEHKYFTHRIIHTGALYPYQCKNCIMGFKLLKTHKVHELQCRGSNKTSFFKCPLCSEIFESSSLLYEHSKTHLKTAYNCVKCDLVFATAADVQKHMTLCNRNVRRIPKQLTPRPPKPKVEE